MEEDTEHEGVLVTWKQKGGRTLQKKTLLADIGFQRSLRITDSH